MSIFTKFGVSYNIFDGEELLEDSILQIRDNVDYISVVYQTESYWGNKCSEGLIDNLDNLKREGLIDKYVHYENKNYPIPHFNQINKRNIGIDLSRSNYCTHHMSMDCDEFYIKEQFSNMINWFNDNRNVVAFADFIDYYKSPSIIIDKLHDTSVSLFFPIKNNFVKFILDYPSPVLVDPTRRPNIDDYEVFKPNFIQMHHMTLVRKNIENKIRNAAKRLNYNTEESIQKIIKYYNNWDAKKFVGLNEEGFLKLKLIEPKFELKNYNKIV